MKYVQGERLSTQPGHAQENRVARIAHATMHSLTNTYIAPGRGGGRFLKLKHTYAFWQPQTSPGWLGWHMIIELKHLHVHGK